MIFGREDERCSLLDSCRCAKHEDYRLPTDANHRSDRKKNRIKQKRNSSHHEKRKSPDAHILYHEERNENIPVHIISLCKRAPPLLCFNCSIFFAKSERPQQQHHNKAEIWIRILVLGPTVLFIVYSTREYCVVHDLSRASASRAARALCCA